MEPERITAAFAHYGNAITWETHLAVVEHLTTWPPKELIELQAALVEHLAAGSWVRTSVGRVVALPDGAQANADSFGSLKSMMSESEYEAAWDERDVTPVVIPPGSIGLPIHPWASFGAAPVDPPRAEAQRKVVRRRLNKIRNRTSIVMGEDGILLRAAPWAYQRLTGARLDGYGPDSREELLSPNADESFTYQARQLIARDDEIVELVALCIGVTAELVAWDWERNTFYRSLLRKLRAHPISPPKVELLATSPEYVLGVGPGDGQLVLEGPSPRDAPANALYQDLRAAMQEAADRCRPWQMKPDQFWRLIGTLRGRADSDSLQSLITALVRIPGFRVHEFQETLAQVLFELDRPDLRPEHLDHSLRVRCAIVAAGREATERALHASAALDEADWEADSAEGLITAALAAREQQLAEYQVRDEIRVDSWVDPATGSNRGTWGDPPIAPLAPAYVVRGVVGDRETIRLWRTRDPEEAIARHLGAHPRSIIDRSRDVLPHANLFVRAVLLPAAEVHFARPIESHQ